MLIVNLNIMGMESFGGNPPQQQEKGDESRRRDIEMMINSNNETMQKHQGWLDKMEAGTPQYAYLADGIENLRKYNEELEKELSELG